MVALLAQQAAVVTTLRMANYSGGEGTYVLFSYINAVYLLPYGVLAIPVVTIMFPSLSGWVGRSKDPESSAEDRGAATVRLHRLTSTTSTVIVSIGLLGTVILMSAAGPLETFFTDIDVTHGESSAPFGALSQAIMVMALAVPGWSFVAWGTRVFYAMERSRHAAVATTVGWVLVIVGMVLAILVTNADGNPGLTLVAICAGYVLGMSVAGLFLLISMRRVLGAAGLRGIVRRGLLSLLAAAIASVAGVFVSEWLAGPLGTEAVGSMINGVVSALVGVVIFIGILAIDRSYLTEVRGLLSSRRGGPDLAEQTDPAVQATRPANPKENEDER